MNIQIYGHNTTVTEALRSHIMAKLAAVEKIIPGIQKIHLSITVNHHHRHGDIFTLDTQLAMGKHSIHITETDSDIYTAVDKTETMLLRQGRKFRTRYAGRQRRLRQLLSPRTYWRWGKRLWRRKDGEL